MASFDECMARQVARPYQFFQSELEMISGSQLLRNVTSMYNRVFGFGNLEPTDNIRVTDCSATSLILNVIKLIADTINTPYIISGH